ALSCPGRAMNQQTAWAEIPGEHTSEQIRPWQFRGNRIAVRGRTDAFPFAESGLLSSGTELTHFNLCLLFGAFCANGDEVTELHRENEMELFTALAALLRFIALVFEYLGGCLHFRIRRSDWVEWLPVHGWITGDQCG